MMKLSLVAASLLLVATAGAALPAAASGVASCERETVLTGDGLYVDRIEVFADQIAMELRQRGYNVESVEPWGGCVRAFITDPGGGSHMQFFDPDTLEPLSTN